MPSKNNFNLRHICEYEHLGALCGKARGGGDFFFFFSFSLLNGAKVTKPGTTEVKFWLESTKARNSKWKEGAWARLRAWLSPYRRTGTNARCNCKCKRGRVQQRRRTPDIWMSCLCGFVITPITALKLVLHVIYIRDGQLLFMLIFFFYVKKKKVY